jgi:hypothetical protein
LSLISSSLKIEDDVALATVNCATLDMYHTSDDSIIISASAVASAWPIYP